jgi:hypothetical protein
VGKVLGEVKDEMDESKERLIIGILDYENLSRHSKD